MAAKNISTGRRLDEDRIRVDVGGTPSTRYIASMPSLVAVARGSSVAVSQRTSNIHFWKSRIYETITAKLGGYSPINTRLPKWMSFRAGARLC